MHGTFACNEANSLEEANPTQDPSSNLAASSLSHHCSRNLHESTTCSAQGLCTASCPVADVSALTALSTAPELPARHRGVQQLCMALKIMKIR